jgi:hypothetical protein
VHAAVRTINRRLSTALCAAHPGQDCTRGAREPRQLTLHLREAHDALTPARREQTTDAWKQAYAARGCGGHHLPGRRRLRHPHRRISGLAKTHLQIILKAAAVNLARADEWLRGTVRAGTRPNPLAALRQAAPV